MDTSDDGGGATFTSDDLVGANILATKHHVVGMCVTINIGNFVEILRCFTLPCYRTHFLLMSWHHMNHRNRQVSNVHDMFAL